MLRRVNKTLPVFRLAASPLASARFYSSSYDSSSSSLGSDSSSAFSESNSYSNSNQDGLAGSSNSGFEGQQRRNRDELTHLTVHFSGLPANATREKLTEALNSAGITGVSRVAVPLNQYTQGSRGFGFVTFDSPESAAKAKGITVNYDGAQLKASGARTTEESKRYRVHIADLSYSTTDADLKAALEQFGPVEFARITSDGGTSRGYGFATFTTLEAADAARKAGRVSLDDRVVSIVSIKERDPSRRGRFGDREGGDRGYGRRESGERSYGSDSYGSGRGRYGDREGGYGGERSYGSDSYGSGRGRYGDRDGGDRGYGRRGGENSDSGYGGRRGGGGRSYGSDRGSSDSLY